MFENNNNNVYPNGEQNDFSYWPNVSHEGEARNAGTPDSGGEQRYTAASAQPQEAFDSSSWEDSFPSAYTEPEAAAEVTAEARAGADRSSERMDFMPSASMDWNTSPSFEKQDKKRRSSGMTRKGAALAVALAVVLSGAAGAGSVFLSNWYLTQSNLSSGSSSGAALVQQTATGTPEYSVQAVAAAAADSVVEITTESVSTDIRMRQSIVEGAGSGVIVSTDGRIVTNHHVIDGASKITVRLRDGDTYAATLIGTDSRNDVALIQIEATGLTAATLGDSDSLQVGEPAVAIGNPLGELGGTVTDGIISALNRDITLDGETMNLLQTNAAINPGNSGGGLFNANGELIGLVVAKSSGTGVEGLGFAIPVNQVKASMTSILSGGSEGTAVSAESKAELGVSLVDIEDQQTAMLYRVSRTGTYVLKVTENSPAAQAGIQSGDCIVSADGTAIESSEDLTQVLSGYTVGQTITLGIIRGNQQGTVQVTL